MRATLERFSKAADGIFSRFTFEGDAAPCMTTLEHAYDDGNGGFEPKVKPGVYKCVRGSHRLAHMDHDFETFEITGVEGHTGILYHRGNFNKDSAGCVLTGKDIVNADKTSRMVTETPRAFAEFMERLEGYEEFDVEVIDRAA